MAKITGLTPWRAAQLLPAPRLPRSRKGQNGRVLVVGGSREYFGSPALVALAALRSGADLCYLIVPEFIAPTIAGYAPDLIVWSYPGHYLSEHAFNLVQELQGRVDVLVVGNGLTKHSNVLRAVKEIISFWEKPLVVDADAIMPGLIPASKEVVFTPHTVEFERLGGAKPALGLNARAQQVSKLASSLKSIVLLKGVEDIASDGATTFVNKTGNAGMTAGGTGDTLAGICGALLAQRAKPLNAAALAAFVNGAAGDNTFKKLGYSLIASDVVTELPYVFKELHARQKKL